MNENRALWVGECLFSVVVAEDTFADEHYVTVTRHKRGTLGELNDAGYPLQAVCTNHNVAHHFDIQFLPSTLTDWAMLALGYKCLPPEYLEDMEQGDHDYFVKYTHVAKWAQENSRPATHDNVWEELPV